MLKENFGILISCIKSNYKISIILCLLSFIFMEHDYINENSIYYFNIFKELLFIGIIFIFNCIFLNLMNTNTFFQSNEKSQSRKLIFYIIPLVPLLIEWLSNLPAKLTTDSFVQLWQITNNMYSDVHPAAHTLFCKLLMQIYNSPGTVIFFQILFLVIINGYIFSYFYKKGLSMKFLIPLLIIWAFLEPIRDVTCYFWKDVFFAIGLFFVTMLIIKIIDTKDNCKIFELILGGLALAVTALFRHNGIFTYVFSVIIFIFLAIKYHKKILLPVIISFLLLICIKGIIYPIYDVVPNDNGTKYALPAKAIISVVYYDGNYTQEELEKIELLLPKDLIKTNYNREDGKTLLWYELHSENGFVGNFQTSLEGKADLIMKLFISLFPKNISIMIYDLLGSASLMLQFQEDFIVNNMSYLYILLICIVLLIKKQKYIELLAFAPVMLNIISIVISNISFESRYAYPTIVCTALLITYSYYSIHKEKMV